LILHLEEETERRLPRDDLAEALALTIHQSFRKYFSIEFPSPANDHCYVLQPSGYIGQIPVSQDLLIRLSPKVPVANVFRMLEYAYNLKSFHFFDGMTRVNTIDDLYCRLAAILAKRVLDRVRKGLYRSYVGHEETMAYVRGRVRVMPTLRASIRGSLHMRCQFEDHTPDLEDNRILAWTLYRLPRLKIERESVRRLIGQAYRALAGTVDVVSMDPKACVGRFYHRLNDDYRPMHGLCRFFLEQCGPGIDEGEREFMPFTLHMPALFESFVAEWLGMNLDGDRYVTPQYRADLDTMGHFAFRIDLVIRDVQTDSVLAVLDTKYKRNPDPQEQEIQQIVAYAESLRTPNAILVYPSSVTRRVVLNVGEKTVRTLSFDIGKDPETAGREFLADLTEALTIG